jgi:hypothetical protein
MFASALLFVALRTFVQVVCDDYASKSGVCENLLKKAFAETLPDIRSAYFLKVMEADNNATAETFAGYHIGFLASNTTYASEAEIIQHACKMPYMTREFLSWTAGVVPLFAAYLCFLILGSVWKRYNTKPITVVEIQEEIEMTAPPKDTPPRSPLYVPRNAEPEPEKKPGIRRRQGRSRERIRQREQTFTTEGPSTLEKLSNLSPSLKNRIMGEDPMV